MQNVGKRRSGRLGANRFTWFDALNYTFLGLLILIMLYPFVNQLAISFNDGNDAVRGGIYFFPRKFSLDSYEYLVTNADLIRGALISLLRVVVGAGACLLFTGLPAYVISQKEFSARKGIRIFYIFTMYFSGGLIPLYLLILRLRLMNTFHVYWVPLMFNAYYMMLITAYIMDLPEALAQSARVDGATELMIYIRIILPVSLPVFATIAIYSAVEHWNSWFDVALYNSGGQWDTLQILLQRMLKNIEQRMYDATQLQKQARRNISSVSIRAATTMIVTIPIICIYPFFQKYFIGGLTSGAVKG